jgi:hypothetical protein
LHSARVEEDDEPLDPPDRDEPLDPLDPNEPLEPDEEIREEAFEEEGNEEEHQDLSDGDIRLIELVIRFFNHASDAHLSNATMSVQLSWAFGDKNSLASCLFKDWKARRERLKIPTTYDQVGSGIKIFSAELVSSMTEMSFCFGIWHGEVWFVFYQGCLL